MILLHHFHIYKQKLLSAAIPKWRVIISPSIQGSSNIFLSNAMSDWVTVRTSKLNRAGMKSLYLRYLRVDSQSFARSSQLFQLKLFGYGGSTCLSTRTPYIGLVISGLGFNSFAISVYYLKRLLLVLVDSVRHLRKSLLIWSSYVRSSLWACITSLLKSLDITY